MERSDFSEVCGKFSTLKEKALHQDSRLTSELFRDVNAHRMRIRRAKHTG